MILSENIGISSKRNGWGLIFDFEKSILTSNYPIGDYILINTPSENIPVDFNF